MDGTPVLPDQSQGRAAEMSSAAGMSNGPLLLGDGHRMPARDGLALPVANCVVCGWPMDGTVDIPEVHVGTVAVFGACAGECPPAGVCWWNVMDRRRYINRRHAVARRVRRQMATVRRLLPTEVGRLRDRRGVDLEINPRDPGGRRAVWLE